jgi:hypothetical protein
MVVARENGVVAYAEALSHSRFHRRQMTVA